MPVHRCPIHANEIFLERKCLAAQWLQRVAAKNFKKFLHLVRQLPELRSLGRRTAVQARFV
jgi:hypothetical protein